MHRFCSRSRRTMIETSSGMDESDMSARLQAKHTTTHVRLSCSPRFTELLPPPGGCGLPAKVRVGSVSIVFGQPLSQLAPWVLGGARVLHGTHQFGAGGDGAWHHGGVCVAVTDMSPIFVFRPSLVVFGIIHQSPPWHLLPSASRPPCLPSSVPPVLP